MANLSAQLQSLIVTAVLLWLVLMGVAHMVFGAKGSAWVGRLPARGASWLAKKLYRGAVWLLRRLFTGICRGCRWIWRRIVTP